MVMMIDDDWHCKMKNFEQNTVNPHASLFGSNEGFTEYWIHFTARFGDVQEHS